MCKIEPHIFQWKVVEAHRKRSAAFGANFPIVLDKLRKKKLDNFFFPQLFVHLKTESC